MMNFFKQNQAVILIVVLLVIGFVVYTYFFTGKEESVLQQEQVSQVVSADQDLISLLLELRGITLDEAIFSDPVFWSLRDFSQDLIPEPVGRENPFAPLGSAGGVVTTPRPAN